MFLTGNAQELITGALDTVYFEGNDPPIPSFFRPGTANLAVVVGPNGGGKSFFRRLVCGICRQAIPKMYPIHLSMEGRGGYMASMVYGDEQYNATGVNSLHTVTGGFNHSRTLDTPHIIVWDEPDVGMSDALAASTGLAMVDFLRDPPPLLRATLVITHRKELVARLASINPHYLHLGSSNPPRSLEEWRSAPVEPVSFQEVEETSKMRFQRIQAILNRHKS